MMKMAIMGAGAIANKMDATITKMEKVEAYAIAARDKERAEIFAGQYGFFTKYIFACFQTHFYTFIMMKMGYCKAGGPGSSQGIRGRHGGYP